jgi:hypothetical protein
MTLRKATHALSISNMREVWNIISGRVGEEWACQSGLYESKALTYTPPTVAAGKLHWLQITQELRSPEQPTAVEPGYNDIGFYTSSIASDILWYQLIPHC